MTTTESAPSDAVQPDALPIGILPVRPGPVPFPGPIPFPRPVVLHDGMFVIGYTGPRVFLVTSVAGLPGFHKRWVPDPTTLFGLDPRGWGDVLTVPNSQLARIPVGPDIPSRLDGKIYRGQDTPEVYVITSLEKHHIPDPETLQAEFGGWAEVAVIAQSDMDAIPLGDPIPSVL